MNASRAFEAALASQDYAAFCDAKVATAKTSADKRTWTFMALIFEPNAREKLLECLGYDAQQIAQQFAPPPPPSSTPSSPQVDDTSAEDVFATRTQSLSISSDRIIEEKSPLTPAAEADVKRALLVGNFDAAVEGCFKNGALADALLLALWRSRTMGKDAREILRESGSETTLPRRRAGHHHERTRSVGPDR